MHPDHFIIVVLLCSAPLIGCGESDPPLPAAPPSIVEEPSPTPTSQPGDPIASPSVIDWQSRLEARFIELYHEPDAPSGRPDPEQLLIIGRKHWPEYMQLTNAELRLLSAASEADDVSKTTDDHIRREIDEGIDVASAYGSTLPKPTMKLIEAYEADKLDKLDRVLLAHQIRPFVTRLKRAAERRRQNQSPPHADPEQ